MSGSTSSPLTPRFSLFENEERVLERAEDLARRFAENSEGVQASFKELILAYQQSFKEQQRLVRVGDRQQEQLRHVTQELKEKNRLLEEQARHLMVLNTELAHEIEARRALEVELRVLATTDVLTGLYNRRRFLELGDYEVQREQRTRKGLSLLVLDIDHFKRVNDQHGHAAGDEVLRRFAMVCKTGLRAMDSMGRMGGEEFAILLPETALDEACQVAERIRGDVAQCAMTVGSEALNVTVSIGVAEAQVDEGFDHLLARADEQLYAAKHAGRNRVVRAMLPPTR